MISVRSLQRSEGDVSEPIYFRILYSILKKFNDFRGRRSGTVVNGTISFLSCYFLQL